MMKRTALCEDRVLCHLRVWTVVVDGVANEHLRGEVAFELPSD